MEYQIHSSEVTSDAVKREIAELEECRPSKLGTLSLAVDVDALDAIPPFEHPDEGTKSFEFQYCGYSDDVNRNGVISILN